MMEKQPAIAKRNHQIDFLRGVAILLVLGRHVPVLSDQAGRLSPLAWFWYNSGWMGVDLFFVLSGFLIGSGLFAEIKSNQKLNAPRFLLKRAFKIWPGYFVLMLFLSTGLTLSAERKQNLIWNWLHLQNYFGSCRVQTWSLAVEEHFYLFLPLLLLLLCKYKKLHLVPAITALLAVLCLTGRCFELNHAHEYSHLRMDSLFFGVFLAYLKQFRPQLIEKLAERRTLLFWLGIALVLPIACMDFHHWFVLKGGLTMLYIGFGAILLASISTDPKHGITGRALFSRFSFTVAWIGYYSYGIYLWHIDAGFFPALALYPLFKDRVPAEASWLIETTLFVFFCILSGVVMSKLVELPMLKLRDKIIPRLFPSSETKPQDSRKANLS